MGNDTIARFGSLEHGYTEILALRDTAILRYVGRCKRCARGVKLEGQLMQGRRANYTDYVIRTADGSVYRCGDLGTNQYISHARCGDHFVKVSQVFEGTKGSKHTCGARCTNATGPSCDCRCKGANHGSGH